MVQIIISGREKDPVYRHAQAMGHACHAMLKNQKNFRSDIETMGPIEAPYAKIANLFRWQMLIKGRHAGLLHAYMLAVMGQNPSLMKNRQVKVTLDVDPVFMM